MPITQLPFSNGCCRYRVPLRSLRRCCCSIRSGIKSATILAFRNWRRKRNRERENNFSELAVCGVEKALLGNLFDFSAARSGGEFLAAVPAFNSVLDVRRWVFELF